MPPNRCELDYDIINVDFYQLADEIMKNIIHGALIRCTGIFNPKIITKYSNKPTAPGTLNAVLLISSRAMKIWL